MMSAKVLLSQLDLSPHLFAGNGTTPQPCALSEGYTHVPVSLLYHLDLGQSRKQIS